VTRPILHYPGSKYRLAPWICGQLPSHVSYLEPYFGAGAVFFRKQPSHVETLNDIDGQVINFFRVVRERSEELASLIELTPWARQEYYDAYTPAGEDLEDARRFAVRMWMARGARTSDRSGWRHDIAGRPHTNCTKVWRGIPDRIREAADRLKDAQIECQPAIDLIRRFACSDVLIYADPPYPLSTRNDKRMYANEMTDADHAELLDALDAHPGPVVLSGYGCDLYDDRLRHWSRRTSRAYAETGTARVEVLWLNPMAAAAAPRLFEESTIRPQ
jgi:DNA adenine methylase